jgi:hypothetical protein
MALPTARDLNRAYGSRFLSKEDVGNERAVASIVDVSSEMLKDKDGKGKERFIVHFDVFDKGLVLNTTNINAIVAALGDDPANWIGAKVVVFVDNSVVFNGNRGGIRLQVLPSRPAKKSGPAISTDPAMNDDIPFER